VDPSVLLPYLTGPVAALVVLIWVVWMQRKDITELRRALDAERSRADSAEEAARTTNQLLSGLIAHRDTS
jgi:hypothetical protein